MKIINKEEQDAQQRATIIGGATGFLGGSAVAFPVSYLLQRRWAYYRALPPSLKAFGVIIVVVPAFVINAERAGQRFEREHWSGAGKEELDTIEAREEDRWRRLSLTEKFTDTARRHQYSFILGGWAASMAIAFGVIARNRYQTLPQKVVQARMWAQGLTIGVLIAGGALTHAQRKKAIDDGPLHHGAVDHSWRDIIEHEQAEADAIAAHSPGAPRTVPRYY